MRIRFLPYFHPLATHRRGWLLFLLVALAVTALIRQVASSIYGVPSGYTGAPLDGVTCATVGCHRGPVSTVSGWITTDVPATGYVPSDTYSVVLAVSRPSTTMFGFQMTTHSPTYIEGSFFITDPVETQYSQGSGYITHTMAGTTGTDQKTWTAQWIAPDDPSVTAVTLYAAVVTGNFDVDDEVFITSRPLFAAPQNLQDDPAKRSLEVYPNPFSSDICISFPDQPCRDVEIEVFSLGGERLFYSLLPSGSGDIHMLTLDCSPAGTLFMRIQYEGSTYWKKLIRIP